MDNSSRVSGDHSRGKEYPGRDDNKPSKPLPIPGNTESSSSGSPSLRNKLFASKSSSDVTGSKGSILKTIKEALSKSPRKEETPSEETVHTITRPTVDKRSVQSHFRGRDSQIESTDEEVVILGEKSTINPKGIRSLFTPPVDDEVQVVTFDFALQYMVEMGQELSRVLDNPNRGLTEFDLKINYFVKNIFPELAKLNLKQQVHKIVEVRSPLCDKFKAIPGSLNEQKDTLDLALNAIYGMCSELVDISQTPVIGMEGLRKKIETFQMMVYPRFRSKIDQLQEPSLIQPYEDGIEKAFSDEIDQFLGNNLFVKLDQFFDSRDNQNILVRLIPEAKEIFRDLDILEKSLDESEDLPQKKDYDFLVSSYKLNERLCKLYCSAVETVCQELSKRSLLDGELSQIGLINEITELLERLFSSKDAKRIYRGCDSFEVRRNWLKRIHDKIRFGYLDKKKPVMMQNSRKMLFRNLAARGCSIPSFNQSLQDFEAKLYLSSPSAPIDIARIFKLEGFVNCFVDNIVVECEANTPVGRFNTLLTTFSVLFDENSPNMFRDLADLLGFPKDLNAKSSTFESDYPKGYSNLIKLRDEENEEIKSQFLESYPSIDFEKALKYFKLSQDCLNQSIIYFFIRSLMEARLYLFRTNLDIVSEKDKSKKDKINESGFKKTKIDIDSSTTKSCCNITVSRFDGILYSDIQLRQDYTYSLNIGDDSFTPPSTVSLSIACPKALAESDEKVRSILFDLQLIAEFLGYPPLKISYT